MSLVPLAEQKELARAATEGGFELVSRCACGALYPGRLAQRKGTLCPTCASPTGGSGGKMRLLEQIPEPFRDGRLDRDLPPVPASAREEALAWLESDLRICTIVAEVPSKECRNCPPMPNGSTCTRHMAAQTGAGKSTLAGGIGAWWAERGKSFEWVSARDLDPTHPDQERARAALRRAERGKRVILDGLGNELAGAGEEAGPGLAVQRKAWMMRWIWDMHERAEKLAVTVDITSKVLMSAYGSGSFRRLARSDRAQVIRLVRPYDINADRF